MHFHHLLPTWKTRLLHHMCTTATLRVHNGRMECSQPIGVVVNNRQSECSHGGWRLCTRLVACVSGRVSCLHEYAEISVISQWFKTAEQEKTEMQEFLPHRVVKDCGMNRKSVRCRAIKSEQRVYCSKFYSLWRLCMFFALFSQKKHQSLLQLKNKFYLCTDLLAHRGLVGQKTTLW